jgi:hyperosmotically inducible periplasmic protein
MKTKYLSAATLLGLSLVATPFVMAGSTQQDAQQAPAPDNTKNNQGAAPTADQQKMDPADRQITKKIRMSIYEDKTISVYAHNIKIITQAGKVTLKGPVRTEDEKNSIVMKATAVAGDGNVDNQITVVPAS